MPTTPGVPVGPTNRRAALALVVAAVAACGDSVAATGGGDAEGTSTGVGPMPTSSTTPGTTAATDGTGTTAGSISESAGSSSTADVPTSSTTTTPESTSTGQADATDASTSTSTTGSSGSTGGSTGTPILCMLEPAPAGPIAIDPACEGDPIKQVMDPWNIAVEWSYVIPGMGAMVMPAVGPLTDDDDDGDVDRDDIPAIAFTALNHTLIVLHGDGSGPVFTMPGMSSSGTAAIADVDGDGAPEVVVYTDTNTVVAIDGAGTIEWTSPAFFAPDNKTATVSDLDEDGDVEVVLDDHVLDGATGSVIAKLSPTWPGTPVVGNLDLLGGKEIVLGRGVYSSTGVLLWSFGPNELALGLSAIANIDDDKEGELLTILGANLYAHEHDGAQIGVYPVPGTKAPGPPCMADFDGDGAVEVGAPRGPKLSMMETDGTVVWQAPIWEGGNAGCSAYDFEGDGSYEILFADEQNLMIFDGATGAVRYVDPNHESATINEYPVVADVDNDGSAEIVATSYGQTYHRLTVYGHVNNGWSAAGRGWQVQDYSVTNVNPDGSVPVSPEPSWSDHNVFRGRPTVDDPALPDLLVTITDTCVECDAQARVVYQVCNQGAVAVAVGAPLTLFALAGGNEVVVETRLLPAIPAGTCLAGDSFAFDPTLLVDGKVIVRLYDDGNGTTPAAECYPANDQATADLTTCG